LPASYRSFFEHDGEEVAIVYQGTVARSQRLALDVPIPDSVFDSAANRRFKLRWTLGFFAPVEPANPVDYSAAGIQVVFRPHARRFNLLNENGVSVGSSVNVDEDRPFIDWVTKERNWRLGEFPSSSEQTGVATEVVQRQFHGKWEGVVRMDKGMLGRSLRRPRLDFHMLMREAGDLQAQANDLEYALVVTVRAPAGIDLYDSTAATATLLTPLLLELPVPIDLDV